MSMTREISTSNDFNIELEDGEKNNKDRINVEYIKV